MVTQQAGLSENETFWRADERSAMGGEWVRLNTIEYLASIQPAEQGTPTDELRPLILYSVDLRPSVVILGQNS